jgi:hypothetical protein
LFTLPGHFRLLLKEAKKLSIYPAYALLSARHKQVAFMMMQRIIGKSR